MWPLSPPLTCASLPGVQILFPKSYQQTEQWLALTRGAADELLDRCREDLQAALAANPEFQALAGGITVRSALLAFRLLLCGPDCSAISPVAGCAADVPLPLFRRRRSGAAPRVYSAR